MVQRPIAVNRKWLPNLWGSFPSHGDWWGHVNLNNERGVQRLIDEVLKPSFEALPVRQQRRLKETFRYALTQMDERELVAAYDEAQLPLDRPERDIRGFYIDIWHGMFGDEEYASLEPEQYIELVGTTESMWDLHQGAVSHEKVPPKLPDG